MKSIDRRKNSIGFTLIELLVVISIIALLVSILMPSLNRARIQAKALVCKTNLKSLYIAEMFYVDDNNGWVPSAEKTPKLGGFWPYRAAKGYKKDNDPQGLAETMGLNALFDDLNYIPYNSDVWKCPDSASNWMAEEYGITYQYNWVDKLAEHKFVSLMKNRRFRRFYLIADNFTKYPPSPIGFYVDKTSKPMSSIPNNEWKIPHRISKEKTNEYGETEQDASSWMLVAIDGFVGNNGENVKQMRHYTDESNE